LQIMESDPALPSAQSWARDRSVPQPERSGGSASAAELRKACERFEGLFLAYLFRVMRESIPESGLLGIGSWQGMFDLFFDQAIGEKAAERASLGIAEMLERQLSRSVRAEASLERTGIPHPVLHTQTSGAELGKRSVKSWVALDDIVSEVARAQEVDPDLVRAVIDVESGGDPEALSPKGAMGLMQLMPQTAREMEVRNPWDPVENLKGGVRYLRRMLDEFGNDLRLALAAYNAGPGAVRRHKGIPPFRETLQYVDEVLKRYQALKRLASAGKNRVLTVG